jgi:hypothetical protein
VYILDTLVVFPLIDNVPKNDGLVILDLALELLIVLLVVPVKLLTFVMILFVVFVVA